jgi:GLPGLI family protein
MKRALFLILIIICLMETKAQYVDTMEIPFDKFTVLDSAQLKFTYLFKYKRSWYGADSDTTLLEDKQSLLIGTKISKYCSDYYFDYCNREMNRKINNEPYKPREQGACGFEIFKNFPDGKITVTDQNGVNILGGYYKYEENSPSIQWKIENDTTTILTYSCQKATTTFRGRSYTAWFAPEIPSNNGPWKFGGLPGLILKISDESQRYMFECIGIKQLKKPEPIKLYNSRYTTLKRLDLDKIYRRFFKDPIQFWDEVGSEMRGVMTTSDLPKMTYNPIELE